ncbi:MAG: GNAT family protein [Christensenellaceae bacterium]
MRLRELQSKDAPFMLEWMHDADIGGQFKKNMTCISKKDVEAFICNSKETKNDVHFAVIDENDEYLGTISLKNINTEDKNAEYAISMRKKAMGTGAAKFATEQIIEYGFYKLGLERIYLNVLSDNKRAVRFYEKFGFCYEGEFKKHIMIDKELKDLKWFAVLKNS